MIKIIIILSICLAGALFLLWSNKSLVTTGHTLQCKDLPSAFDGFTITQVSDLQSATFGERQEALLKKVKESNPDIIVITGDLVDRNHTDYEASLTAAKGLVDIAPVYYVNGNHELSLPVVEIEDFYDQLREMGVTVLFDAGEEIVREKDQSIFIVGLSEERIYASKADQTKRDSDYDASVIEGAVERITENLAEDSFSIMLVHEPQYLEQYAGHGIDLIFAGHAHGGQIRLPFTDGLYAPGQGILPKMTSGVHEQKDTRMVISRGLGNSVFPFRVFNRPEVVTVTLKGE